MRLSIVKNVQLKVQTQNNQIHKFSYHLMSRFPLCVITVPPLNVLYCCLVVTLHRAYSQRLHRVRTSSILAELQPYTMDHKYVLPRGSLPPAYEFGYLCLFN